MQVGGVFVGLLLLWQEIMTWYVVLVARQCWFCGPLDRFYAMLARQGEVGSMTDFFLAKMQVRCV